MSPHGISSGFDEIFSTDSSDSEFLSQVDVKSRGNQINKQWEAIERTLYQEPGQQVTDPELLRECKLWRESFPHFRVKGTKIEVKALENKVEETDKNVQTLENHFNLKKLEEKRESIKKKVVGVLVERLIAKFGSEKRESAKSDSDHSRGVQITEIDDETAEKMSSMSPGALRQVKNSSEFPTAAGTKNESYFERGKPLNREVSSPEEGLTVEQVEKKLGEIFDSWTNERTATKLPQTAKIANLKQAANSARENPVLRSSVKSKVKSNAEKFKSRKFIPPIDSLSGIAKPFEITTKFDKKYDGLIERIMDRQNNKFNPTRQCRTSSYQENYQGPLGKLRTASGFDDQTGTRSLPRLNKFSNPWLDRSELNAYHNSVGDHVLQKITHKSSRAPESLFTENMNQRDIDEKFLEELKMEMALSYKRPPRKSGFIEEISLRRPKPFAPTVDATVKSSSLGDLTRRNKKGVKGGLPKRGLEQRSIKEPGTQSRVRSSIPNGSKGNKINGSQNFLPPFETGIICTELTGRPKIGPKNPPKRH